MIHTAVVVMSLQVSVTVDSILQDMQTKYQDAVDQLSHSVQTQTKAQADMQVIKQAQAEKLKDIKQLCQ